MALILNLLSFPLEVPLCVCASYLKNFWFGSGTSSLPSFPRFSFCLAYSDFFLKWHTCSNVLDVCTLKLHMNMLLLFMICGHTSLLLFILSYNDNEYKTLWKCQNQTDLKNCFINWRNILTTTQNKHRDFNPDFLISTFVIVITVLI